MVEHIPSSVRCYRLIKSQLERAPSCTVQCILYVLCTSMYTGLHRGNNIGRWPRIAGIPEGDHRWTRSWCRWRLPDDAHGARWFPQRLSIENAAGLEIFWLRASSMWIMECLYLFLYLYLHLGKKNWTNYLQKICEGRGAEAAWSQRESGSSATYNCYHNYSCCY